MSIIRTAAIVGLALFISLPAFGWNFAGHRVIAAIAYDRLTPATRAKVDELIRNHPDYQLFVKDAPADPAARAKAAFEVAATWPDIIRTDARFYDETRPDPVPTPSRPNFPDMKRHVTWHYYDIPYTQDGTPGKPTPPPNALTELKRLLAEIGTVDAAQASYDLPWLAHLVGDVHQPLHATSRFSKTLPNGDQGGNLVFLYGGKNLHSYWDGAIGEDQGLEHIDMLARKITGEHPQPQQLSLDPQAWMDESYRIVKSDLYTFGGGNGTREYPIVLPANYINKAQRIASQRIATAGYRLAEVLNVRLR